MDTLKHLEIEKEKRDSLDKYGIIDSMTYVTDKRNRNKWWGISTIDVSIY